MATAFNLKRKNIDLPTEAIQKLSLMAVAQGKSLKAYIEHILISKANTINIEVSDTPSPSGDDWFKDPSNIADVKEGISQHQQGKTKIYSMEDIKNVLGV